MFHRSSRDHDCAVRELLPRATNHKVSGSGGPDRSIGRPSHGGVVVGTLHQLVPVKHSIVVSNPASDAYHRGRQSGSRTIAPAYMNKINGMMESAKEDTEGVHAVGIFVTLA